jgi:hypothetical protein
MMEATCETKQETNTLIQFLESVCGIRGNYPLKNLAEFGQNRAITVIDRGGT